MKHNILALSILHPDPKNVRGADLGDIEELAVSLREHGVLQPITVRAHPKKKDEYMLVFGHRRLAAAKKAGLESLPAGVVTVTDEVALEMQLVENCNRKDISAFAQAHAYQRLRDEFGLSADDVAARVTKSRSWVYGRLKLLELIPAAVTLLANGALSESHALLIARMPDEDAQKAALLQLDTSPSYRAFKSAIEKYVMRPLASAPFKMNDATLDAVACNGCPHRTGTSADLFGDVKGKNLCTLPSCFSGKTEAFRKRRREEHVAAGGAVIKSGPRNGLAGLDEGCWDISPPKNLSEEEREEWDPPTWRELLGKDHGLPITLCKGEIEAIVEYDAAVKIGKKQFEYMPSKPSENASTTPIADLRSAHSENGAKRKVEVAAAGALKDATAAAFMGSSTKVRLAVASMQIRHDGKGVFLGLPKAPKTASDIVDIVAADIVHNTRPDWQGTSKTQRALAEILGLDPKKILREARAAAKTAKKKAKKKAKKA